MIGRKSAETVHSIKTPKHIAEIGMTPNEYYDLKVHVKSIALPGTPGFDGKRFNSKEHEKAYRQWLDNALLKIGPKFFPRGGRGLVWPDDYDGIYRAVHQVVRTLSYKIRKDIGRKMEGVSVTEGRTGNDQMKVGMAGVGERYESGPSGGNNIDEDVAMVSAEAPQRQRQEEEIAVVRQYDQGEDVTEEEMKAAAIELGDLLDLMKPEEFFPGPDLTDEDFNLEEVADFSPRKLGRHS